MPALLIEHPRNTSDPRPPASRRMLVVCHGFPPYQTSGGEIHMYRKVLWWRAHGHEVRVIAANPTSAANLPFGTIEECDEEVDGIEVRRVRFAAPDGSRPVRETFDNPALRTILEREIEQFKPDLMYQVSGYLFGILPLQLARQHDLPAVLFANDYWFVCPRLTLLRPYGRVCNGPSHPADCAACRFTARRPAMALGPSLNHRLWQAVSATGRQTQRVPMLDIAQTSAYADRTAAIQQALGFASLVVVNSQFLAGWLGSLGVPQDRLFYVRQGIDPCEFSVTPADTSLPEPDLRLLYLGQVTHHKGVDLIIEAVSLLRDEHLPVTLDIFGPQTDGDAFLRRVRFRIDGTGIRLHPPVTRMEIAAMLPSYHVLAVPGRWYDNSPNVILEAFSAGLPVVTTNHGGTAEMVHDGVDGLLFDPGDANSLADAIRRMASEPGLLAKLRSGIQRPHDIDVEMRAEEAEIARLIPIEPPGRA